MSAKKKPSYSVPNLLTALRSLLSPSATAISICSLLWKQFPEMKFSSLDIKNAIESLKIQEPQYCDLLREVQRLIKKWKKEKIKTFGDGD